MQQDQVEKKLEGMIDEVSEDEVGDDSDRLEIPEEKIKTNLGVEMSTPEYDQDKVEMIMFMAMSVILVMLVGGVGFLGLRQLKSGVGMEDTAEKIDEVQDTSEVVYVNEPMRIKFKFPADWQTVIFKEDEAVIKPKNEVESGEIWLIFEKVNSILRSKKKETVSRRLSELCNLYDWGDSKECNFQIGELSEFTNPMGENGLSSEVVAGNYDSGGMAVFMFSLDDQSFDTMILLSRGVESKEAVEIMVNSFKRW